jgi:CRP-like cAMP-binding protein
MTIEDDIGFLERVPALALLGREALRILAIGAENRYVHGGALLFRQGDLADAGYVVQEGSFQLASDAKAPAKAVTAGPGAIICDVALLIEIKYPVTATASQPSTVIRISRSLFRKMLEGYPEAAVRLRDKFLAQMEEASQDMRLVRAKLGGSEALR